MKHNEKHKSHPSSCLGSFGDPRPLLDRQGWYRRQGDPRCADDIGEAFRSPTTLWALGVGRRGEGNCNQESPTEPLDSTVEERNPGSVKRPETRLVFENSLSHSFLVNLWGVSSLYRLPLSYRSPSLIRINKPLQTFINSKNVD